MKRKQVHLSIFISSLFLFDLICVRTQEVTVSSTNKSFDSIEKESNDSDIISSLWCGQSDLSENMIDTAYGCLWLASGDFDLFLQLTCENELFPVEKMSKNDVRRAMCSNDKVFIGKYLNCRKIHANKLLQQMMGRLKSSKEKNKFSARIVKPVTGEIDSTSEQLSPSWKQNDKFIVSHFICSV